MGGNRLVPSGMASYLRKIIDKIDTFKWENERMNKRGLIWGTGKNAEKLIRAKGNLNIQIIGLIETHKKSEEAYGLPVYSADAIGTDYDYIIVANTHTKEIYRYVKEIGIDSGYVIYLKFCPYIDPYQNIETIKDILGEQIFQLYCSEYGLIEYSFFTKDKKIYDNLNTRESFATHKETLWPVIDEKYANAGTVNNYFWQDLWAARLIYNNMPREHYDIGSRLDGFIAHILCFGIPVKMIDIRPFPTEIKGLETIVDDATFLGEFADNSIESLSALCSLEHFGLGRYGDPINPEACFICFENIQRKIKRGVGNLYIAVPVGRERVEFNAHRVFYPSTIVDSFSQMELADFAYTADGKLEQTMDLHKYDNDKHNGDYRYGLFHFVK